MQHYSKIILAVIFVVLIMVIIYLIPPIPPPNGNGPERCTIEKIKEHTVKHIDEHKEKYHTDHDSRYTYEDGTYRGVFIDGSDIQVNVEFTLEHGVVKEAGFRWLKRDEDYHLETEEEPYRSVVQQYREALAHLEGKKLQDHLTELYTPEKIVTTEVDGYTSATIRRSKILSAIRDALNRGVYSHPEQ